MPVSRCKAITFSVKVARYHDSCVFCVLGLNDLQNHDVIVWCWAFRRRCFTKYMQRIIADRAPSNNLGGSAFRTNALAENGLADNYGRVMLCPMVSFFGNQKARHFRPFYIIQCTVCIRWCFPGACRTVFTIVARYQRSHKRSLLARFSRIHNIVRSVI